MLIRDLGLIGYRQAYALQETLAAEVLAGGEETLLLLEHHPVYTLGSGGDAGNLLDPAIEALRVNRGGDVTFHGPGQLVGYPILDLAARGRDLHRYLRFLEGFLVEIAGHFGVGGFTVAGRTGVWTETGKIAAIGVGVRRWVSLHGFCLNVAADTAPFERINPCGLPDCPISTLSGETGREVAVAEVKDLVQDRFRDTLHRQLPHSTLS